MKNKIEKNTQSLHELSLIYKSTKCEKVFNKIYKKLEYPLFEHIFKILKNAENAKIVREHTFEKMFLNIDNFNPTYKFTTWIYNIAKHEAYYFYKKNKKNTAVLFCDMSIDESADAQDFMINALFENADNDIQPYENSYVQMLDEEFDDMMLSKKYNIAMDCIDCLPDQYSLILKEKYINQMKQKDIAEKYGIKFNTVKTRIFNATQNVKVLYHHRVNKLLIEAEDAKL